MTQAGAAPQSRIVATFSGDAATTRLERLGETGHLRLRLLRGKPAEALVVNTAGGLVGGDRLALSFAVHGAGAALTIGTAAAEKCYRAAADAATVDTRLAIADGAVLHWLPQELILFDGACLRRSLDIDLDADGVFVGLETIVFGRLARGEVMQTGSLRDSWRLRRAGRLVFADETALADPVGATLDRNAVGGGARAISLLVAAGIAIGRHLEPIRAVLASFAAGPMAVEAGASVRADVLVVRLLSRSPERLRACAAAALHVIREAPMPRGWT